MSRFSKILSIVFGLVILGGIGVLVYSVAFLDQRDAYTEFYALGPGGKPEGYPESLRVGDEGRVTLVIINREKIDTTYEIEGRIDGVTTDEIGPIMLEPDTRYEGMVKFNPQKPGKDIKIEFLLFVQGESEIHNSLYLLVDVEE